MNIQSIPKYISPKYFEIWILLFQGNEISYILYSKTPKQSRMFLVTFFE